MTYNRNMNYHSFNLYNENIYFLRGEVTHPFNTSEISNINNVRQRHEHCLLFGKKYFTIMGNLYY